MAQDKKGFILYADQKELFDQLPNDKAGELIKHIFSYVNDENPITDDLLIKLAFTPIKQQLKRDLKKFEETKKQRSDAGKRSAELRKKQRDSTPLDSVERSSTKATVKENDNVNVKDKVIEREIKSPRTFFETKDNFLRWFSENREQLTGIESNFNTLYPEQQTDLFTLKKSYTYNDFTKALKNLCQDKWAKENNQIIPKHFLNLDNFAKYLNQESKGGTNETLQERSARLMREEMNR
jgi:hypothetical protein